MTETYTWAVIALSIALLIWCVVGWLVNRRRVSRLLGWAREGIQGLGGKAAWRSFGTSGFQVAVKGVKHPFKRIEMTVLLESREMHLVWLFNHLRGRRDLMLLKADLRTRPKAEVEVVSKKGRTIRKILDAIEEENWARGELEYPSLMVLRKG